MVQTGLQSTLREGKKTIWLSVTIDVSKKWQSSEKKKSGAAIVSLPKYTNK